MHNNFKKTEEYSLPNIVHDLKIPITSIIGFVEMLKKSPRDEKTQNEFYDIIEFESYRLLEMVNSILHNHKNSEKTEINDIGILINKHVDELRPLANKKNIIININLEPGLFISIPKDKIARIFLNIIENAIKYNIPSGKILIDIYKKDKFIIVKFQNTGIGINKEEVDKIFDKYFRAQNSKNLKIPGTGLGLAISREIIESYGGSIAVNSEIDKKTEFIISLPEI